MQLSIRTTRCALIALQEVCSLHLLRRCIAIRAMLVVQYIMKTGVYDSIYQQKSRTCTNCVVQNMCKAILKVFIVRLGTYSEMVRKF